MVCSDFFFLGFLTYLFIYFSSFICISIRNVNHLIWFDYLFIFVLLLGFISVVCLIIHKLFDYLLLFLYLRVYTYLLIYFLRWRLIFERTWHETCYTSPTWLLEI